MCRGVATGKTKQAVSRGPDLRGGPLRTADYVRPQQQPLSESPGATSYLPKRLVYLEVWLETRTPECVCSMCLGRWWRFAAKLYCFALIHVYAQYMHFVLE